MTHHTPEGLPPLPDTVAAFRDKGTFTMPEQFYPAAEIDAREALRAQAASVEPEQSDNVTILPDGSAFAVGSFPLPSDHWLYALRGEWDAERDDFKETPNPILSNSHRDAVTAAVRYAVRGATMCGREMDFDPDALVLNACYALCGPATGGTSASAPPAHIPADAEARFEALWSGLSEDNRKLVADYVRDNMPAPQSQAVAASSPAQALKYTDVDVLKAHTEGYKLGMRQEPAQAVDAVDEIRALGWSVAIHNDYRLNGEPHTFWLFTKDGQAVKGEGRTDAEALGQVRAALATLKPQAQQGGGEQA